jgi:hypothetical protein
MKIMDVVFVLCASALLPHSAVAADTISFTLAPVALDSKEGGGSAIGIQYELADEFRFASKGTGNEDNSGSEPLNPDQDLSGLYGRSGFVKFDADGTWTVDKEDNPASTAQAKIVAGYGSFQEKNSLDLGGFVGLEGDQDYENRNTLYGVELGGHYSFTEDASTYATFFLDYGQVDASGDEERMALTGDDSYDRFSGELQLSYGLQKLGTAMTSIISLQLNYRYYQEVDAPDIIRDNDWDRYALATFLLRFHKGLYLAYSSGTLPFDKQNDKIFSIGFSQNIF